MRVSQAEKMEIIRIVEQSPLGIKRTLKELKVNRSTFYNWYAKYQKEGYDGLAPRKPTRSDYWNRIPDDIRNEVVDLALDRPELSARELATVYTDTKAYHVSESSVYRILKEKGLIPDTVFTVHSAADEFKDKTTRVNELWQTDFTYFKVLGWGWYYLSTILDDYSRYIVSWKLCRNMKRNDVERTVSEALGKYDIPRESRPRLLSDNGACYIASELKTFLHNRGIDLIHGAPHHPQTQGKIERYHRSMKIVILKDVYHSPEELEAEIAKWVEYYNNHRYHESIDNLTPSDVYFGRDREIIQRRKKIKYETMMLRRKIYQHSKQVN